MNCRAKHPPPGLKPGAIYDPARGSDYHLAAPLRRGAVRRTEGCFIRATMGVPASILSQSHPNPFLPDLLPLRVELVP